jgi:hypothetical protein
VSNIDSQAPTAPVPPAPRPNPFQRIIGVFISPGETFASIARQPDWVVAVLVIVVISLAAGVLIAQRVDFNTLAREAMEMNPQAASMPADRMETSVRFTAGLMKVSTYLSPFLSVLVLLIVSAVLLLVFRLFGGEGTFLQAFSTTTYAWYPRVVKGVLAAVVILSRNSLSIFDLQNPLMSNLGFLFDPKTQPLHFALASSLDIFSIWSLILLIIGFSQVSRLSRAKSAAIVIGLWVVANMFALIGPAMQTLRK